MKIWLSLASSADKSLDGVIITDADSPQDAANKVMRDGLAPTYIDDIVGFPVEDTEGLPENVLITKAEMAERNAGKRTIISRCPHGYPVAVRDAEADADATKEYVDQ